VATIGGALTVYFSTLNAHAPLLATFFRMIADRESDRSSSSSSPSASERSGRVAGNALPSRNLARIAGMTLDGRFSRPVVV
jgi:hypothetical protein